MLFSLRDATSCYTEPTGRDVNFVNSFLFQLLDFLKNNLFIRTPVHFTYGFISVAFLFYFFFVGL